MRTVKEVIKEIAVLRETASMSVENVPWGQRPAFQMSVIQANQKIPELLKELKGICIPGRLIGLFAYGDKEAIEETGAFLIDNEGIVLDAEAVYRSVADLVEPSYGPERVFDVAPQMALLVQKISEIGINLGYWQIEAPKFQEAICKDYAATLSHVRNILRECGVGDQANIDILTNEVIDAIVKGVIDSKQIPVLVKGVSSIQEQNAIATMFNKTTTHTFKSNFEPTEKSIVAMFKKEEEQHE